MMALAPDKTEGGVSGGQLKAVTWIQLRDNGKVVWGELDSALAMPREMWFQGS